MARPVRTFQVIGISVLVLGTVAGVTLGFDQQRRVAISDPVAIANVPSPTPTPDSGRDVAAALAHAKAVAAAASAADRVKKANDAARRAQAASRSTTRPSYPIPASCKEYTGNRAIGCALMLEAGFGLAEMPCLDRMWTKESGWNHKAVNKSSGAYGIPQALPGSKMASEGSDWRTSPVPQIKWGLGYIKGRYKSPCGAWNFWLANHWY